MSYCYYSDFDDGDEKMNEAYCYFHGDVNDVNDGVNDGDLLGLWMMKYYLQQMRHNDDDDVVVYLRKKMQNCHSVQQVENCGYGDGVRRNDDDDDGDDVQN